MNAAGGTATLTNVDFVANGGTGGAGLRLGPSDSLGPNNATVTVTNSILWGNTIRRCRSSSLSPEGASHGS